MQTPKAGLFRREREGAPATRAQTHDRREYPAHGVLRDAQARRSRPASRTGAGLELGLPQRPRDLLPVQPHLRPSGAGRRAPNRRRHARRAAPHLRRNGRYGLLREHRTLFRAQGARVGIRRCRRPLFHGCIHPQFTERG